MRQHPCRARQRQLLNQQAADLVKLLGEANSSAERKGIEKALLAICGRGGASCIPHLRPLTTSGDDELQMIGLHALAIIGGPDALAIVKSAAAGAEPVVQDEAVRILSTWPNNWPQDDDAGQTLLTLAKSAEKMTHQVLGLRGYLQYIRGTKNLSSEQKVGKVSDIWPDIQRPEEKRQAIAVLGEAPSASSLELLTQFAEDPALAEEAYSAMVAVAGTNVPGISRDQRRQILQEVIKKSQNNGTKQRAQRSLGRIR